MAPADINPAECGRIGLEINGDTSNSSTVYVASVYNRLDCSRS